MPADDSVKVCDGTVLTMLFGLCLCVLILMGLPALLIWHGNELRIKNEAFKPGIAIEADCTVLHRTSKKCSCGKGCGSRTYSYLANSTACPGITLSTAKKEQKCKIKNMKTYKENDDVHKCYIDSCESGKFVFDYRANRRGPYTFIVIGSLIAAHCVCFVSLLMCNLCTACCDGNDQSKAKNEYASKADIEWATPLPGPYKPYDVVSKDDETDIEMETTTQTQGEGHATAAP